MQKAPADSTPALTTARNVAIMPAMRQTSASLAHGGTLGASVWRRVFLALLLALLGVQTARAADDDSPAAFFRAERERMRPSSPPQTFVSPFVVQRPTHLIRRSAPVRGFARIAPGHVRAPTAPEARAPEPSANEPPAAAPADAIDATTADRTPPAGETPALPAPVAATPAPRPPDQMFNALIIGDSLGVQLGQGLTEAFADRSDITVIRRARENTGLVRDDYFDWMKGARDLLATTPKVDIGVMMIGSNDRQQLRDGAASLDMRQPRWREIYGDRVEAIAKAFKERNIPLVWVGLPVMKSDRFSADMTLLNEIYQDRAGKSGAVFVDTWEAFLDDRGQFAAYGPDVNGLFQKLRAGDGVHFTKAGGRKLAHFVESEIRHAVEDARPAIDPQIAAVPVAAPPAPARAAEPAVVAPSRPAAVVELPAPEEPKPVIIPVKPAAGPVLPLTGPTPTPGGTLVTRAEIVSAAASATAPTGRDLADEPRPGRADDFHWPRR